MQPKIIELTKENQELYLDQIAKLEIKVLENMEKNGKTGQLFITGKDDIAEYINSEENLVLAAVNGNNKVISATYITQGQKPFTYNDITKYFKSGKDYTEHIKSKFDSTKNYQKAMIETYELKLQAFEYAKSKVLSENPEYKSFSLFLNDELQSQNGFDEKSKLRDGINRYMSEFIEEKAKTANPNLLRNYEYFYWTSCNDIFEELCKTIPKEGIKNNNVQEYESFLKKQQLEIHSTNLLDKSKYFNANTSNSIEIDTYITDPSNRHSGIARILVYEGIKKKILENFQNSKNNEIYLCSTLHKDNFSSKYVSEFFGLKDNMFVKRRANRDREVHITRIKREYYMQYLTDIKDKLIVLYGYNPNGKILSTNRKLNILKEQYKYEKEQYLRLNKIRNTQKNYTGSLKDIMPKLNKMGKIRQMIKQLEPSQKQGDAK